MFFQYSFRICWSVVHLLKAGPSKCQQGPGKVSTERVETIESLGKGDTPE